MHQLQQYYITGNVDDCSSKWSALIDCLKKRTKFRDEVCSVLDASHHPTRVFPNAGQLGPSSRGLLLHSSMQVLLVEAETKHPLWDIRTHAEAQEFWDKSFGHLRGDGGAAAAAAAAEAGGAAEGAREGKQHSGRPTLV